jgi:ABC-type lipoprotein export system ATPase subunit
MFLKHERTMLLKRMVDDRHGARKTPSACEDAGPINSLFPVLTLLRCEALRMEYDDGAVVAVADATLDIHEGEFVAITGPSGCGKSTLLQLFGLLDVPTGGRLFYGPTSYEGISDASLFRRQRFGFVFQSFHLIATLTALENVIAPTLAARGLLHHHVHRARELLFRLGLEARMDQFPGRLSGGERQRVAIARALINDPPVILADEPTGSLDSNAASEVLRLLIELRQERGLTLVIVTHDAAVSSLADRIIQMRDGRVVEVSSNERADAT